MRRSSTVILAFWGLLGLPGCGTVVPSLRDWPANSGPDESRMIGQIVRAVRCQLGASIDEVVQNDHDLAKERPNRKRYSDVFDTWGAEANITITVTDKTGLNPSTLLAPPSPPSSIFTLGAGLDASAEAVKSVKLNTFYTMRQLHRRPCPVVAAESKMGSPLVATDLEITSLLEGRLHAIRAGDASPLDEPGRANVLSHTVRFTVNTGVNVTPSWKLPHATINPGGPVFSTSRDRIHELVITFGPLDRDRGGMSLIPIAEQTHINTIAPRAIQIIR